MQYISKHLKMAALAAIFCVLANFSGQDEMQTPNAVHSTNFFGIVIPLQGDPIKVENISISGLFDTIPVYAIPLNTDTDPAVNTTRLRLSDITSITTVFVEGKPKVLNFKGRDYVEINVEFKDKTINTYIIERSRQIFCYESFDALPKREFSLEGIKKLIVEGSSSRDRLCDAENKLRQATSRLIGSLKSEFASIDNPEQKEALLKVIENFENETKETTR